jgi:hypothetical protein
LADVGFLEGRDVTIEYRAGSFEQQPALPLIWYVRGGGDRRR